MLNIIDDRLFITHTKSSITDLNICSLCRKHISNIDEQVKIYAKRINKNKIKVEVIICKECIYLTEVIEKYATNEAQKEIIEIINDPYAE